MEERVVQQLVDKLREAEPLYHRLVLLIGPPGSGKTECLVEVSRRQPLPLINVSLELSRSLLPLTERHYFVRNRLISVHSTIRPRVFGVNTLPRVASSNFFMSSRRTPKPRPPIHATTWNRGFPPTAP